MDGLMKIENDVLCVAARLREIDPRYEVYRNTRRHRFEIYADGALQIAVPFARLDARTIDLVRETRAERAEELLQKLECGNMRSAKRSAAEAKDRAARLLEETL